MADLADRQGFGPDDQNYQGSTVDELRAALYENPYCDPWPGIGKFRWPTYRVTLRSLLHGFAPGGRPYQFLSAARRTIDSHADLRWGPDALGYRRLLHPNGICLIGRWIIDQDTEYTGYFKNGSTGRVVTRYSTCCTTPLSGHTRSLSIVGKLFQDEEQRDECGNLLPTVPASFITQEDLGGSISSSIRDVELRNAPDTTFYKRGWDAPILALTGLTFLLVDREPAFRQLYQIAELGKPKLDETNAPRFMRLVIDNLAIPTEQQPLDFRDEIMAQIYDPHDSEPKRMLTFHIEVADEGTSRGPMLLQKRHIQGWKRIGRLELHEAVASYNGDYVLHFHHPAWRTNRNAAITAIRQHRKRTRW